MTPLVEPPEITTHEKDQQNYDPHLAKLMRTIFGPRFGKLKICHMSSANGVGQAGLSSKLPFFFQVISLLLLLL